VDPDADLAAVASLIADRHRAQILLTLLGGIPQSGSALADAAGISRALASAHLKKLVAGGLVNVRPEGRQRLYSIASPPVADALEILTLLAPPLPVRSLRDATRAHSLHWARMCYDHLAGTVGVAISDSIIDRELVAQRDGAPVLTPLGAAEFTRFGIDVAGLSRGSRPLLRPCMDWTERRYHLAGNLGAAIASALVGRDWIARRSASRILNVTPAGQAGLLDWLGLDLEALRAA
jgi:DNA-binding transcriptional ArsR family regulator